MKYLKQKAVFEIFLVVSLSILFSIAYSSPASAVEQACCEKTKSGQWCQFTDKNECEGSSVFPGTCDNFEACKPVCCDLSTVPGEFSCQKTVSKLTCSEIGGTPLPDASCNYPQCQPGCCMIGAQGKFTIERGCTDLANTLGIPADQAQFKPEITTELECTDLALKQRTGCCIAENKDCSMGVGTQCEGEFFADTFCSSLPAGKCDQCKGEKVKKCLEGSPDVWNFDKCGNKEAVGEECHYATDGKACDEDKNGARCKDLSCGSGTEINKPIWDNPRVDENKDGDYTNDKLVRKNGDAWCEYDGDSGPGVDLPGSRHFKHACLDGKEVVEECGDFRTEICMEGKLQSKDFSRSFAACRENKGDDCSTCKDKDCCQDTSKRECVWNGNEKSGFCLPLVPPGHPFWQDAGSCNVASSSGDGIVKPAKAAWEEEIEWDCEQGCSVYSRKFLKGMNNICISYGDCGAGYNLLGQWNGMGFERSTSTDVDRDELDDINEQSAIDQIRSENEFSRGNCDDDGDDCANEVISYYRSNPKLNKDIKLFDDFKENKGLLKLGTIDLSNYEVSPTQMIVFYSVVGVTAAAVVTGAILATTSLGATALLTIGPAISAILTYAGVASAAGPVGWVIAGVLVLTAVVLYLTSPEAHTDTINITCNAWQSPQGGEYCHLCHEKGEYKYLGKDGNQIKEDIDFTAAGLHECTEYLCKSLGARCEYIDTEDGSRCIDNDPRDTTPPFIKPLEGLDNHCVATSGGAASPEVPCEIVEHPGAGYEIKPFIKQSTHVQFGVKTCKDSECKEQDFATCQFDTERKENYDELTRSFQQTGYSYTHNTTLIAGSDLENGNKYSYYLICIDKSGLNKLAAPYQISFEVAAQPDTTPPLIKSIDHNGLVANDVNITQIGLTLDEKADCKFSIHDLPFEEMEKEAQCFARSGELPACAATITNITEGERLYFFRCKDKAGNVNQQSFPSEGFTLKKTPALKIDEVKCIHQYGESCDDDIFQKNITLQIMTSAGAEQGVSYCGASSTESMNPEFIFLQTNSTIHRQENLGPFDQGDKKFNLICKDSAGNTANQFVTLKIKVDEVQPVIQKLYVLGATFTVETDEISTCSVSTKLTMEEPVQLATEKGLEHVMQVDKDIVFLQCTDRFGNSGPIYQVSFTKE